MSACEGFLDAETSGEILGDAGVFRVADQLRADHCTDVREHHGVVAAVSRTRIEYVTLPRVCPGVRWVRSSISAQFEDLLRLSRRVHLDGSEHVILAEEEIASLRRPQDCFVPFRRHHPARRSSFLISAMAAT